MNGNASRDSHDGLPARTGTGCWPIVAVIALVLLGSCSGFIVLVQWGHGDILAICTAATPGRDVGSVEADATARGAHLSRVPARPSEVPPKPAALVIGKGRFHCVAQHADGRVIEARRGGVD